MSGHNAPTTEEFEARREWFLRFFGHEPPEGAQAEAVSADMLVTRYEAVDTNYRSMLTNMAPDLVSAWPTDPPLGLKAIVDALGAVKADLTAIDAEVVAKAASITSQLDQIDQSVAAVEKLSAKLASLPDDARALRDEATELARHHTGNTRNAINAVLSDLQAVLGDHDAASLIGAQATFARCKKDLAAVTRGINDRFDDLRDAALAQSRELAGLQPLSAPEALMGAATAEQDVRAALAAGANNLEAGEAALVRLKDAVDWIKDDRLKSAQAEADYFQLAPKLAAFRALAETPLDDESNQRAIDKISELIAEGGYDTIEQDAQDNGWSYVGDTVDDLAALIAGADNIFAQDQAASAALAAAGAAAQAAAAQAAALAQQAAAQALLAAQQAAAAAHAQAVADGDVRFGAPDLMRRVWNKTKEGGEPNRSIGGTYTYNDIYAAIAIWNGVSLNGGTACHVPGGGNIEDKMTKADVTKRRDEIQADFISDWADGKRINVHVDLRKNEWWRFRP